MTNTCNTHTHLQHNTKYYDIIVTDIKTLSFIYIAPIITLIRNNYLYIFLVKYQATVSVNYYLLIIIMRLDNLG